MELRKFSEEQQQRRSVGCNCHWYAGKRIAGGSGNKSQSGRDT